MTTPAGAHTDPPEPPIDQRYAALVAVVTEVADELERRGLDDLASRLHGAASDSG